MVLEALYLSSNCLYTKSKSAILRSLKGEAGQELSASKLSNSYSSFSDFLISNLSSFHLFIADNVVVFECSSVIYPHIMFSSSHFQNVFNREGEWDSSLGFLRERFSKRHNNSYNAEKCSFTIIPL